MLCHGRLNFHTSLFRCSAAGIFANVTYVISGNTGRMNTSPISIGSTSGSSYPSRNVVPGDVVLLQGSGTAPMKWPLGRVLVVHLGQDDVFQVVILMTMQVKCIAT